MNRNSVKKKSGVRSCSSSGTFHDGKYPNKYSG